MSDLASLERKVDKLIKMVSALTKDDLINEEQAAAYLGMTVRSFQNLVYSNKIPKEVYRLSLNGKRMYHKSKLVL